MDDRSEDQGGGRERTQGEAYARALERSGAPPARVLRVRAELEDVDGYLPLVALFAVLVWLVRALPGPGASPEEGMPPGSSG